jgi:hypothetical protein
MHSSKDRLVMKLLSFRNVLSPKEQSVLANGTTPRGGDLILQFAGSVPSTCLALSTKYRGQDADGCCSGFERSVPEYRRRRCRLLRSRFRAMTVCRRAKVRGIPAQAESPASFRSDGPVSRSKHLFVAATGNDRRAACRSLCRNHARLRLNCGNRRPCRAKAQNARSRLRQMHQRNSRTAFDTFGNGRCMDCLAACTGGIEPRHIGNRQSTFRPPCSGLQ